MIKKSLFALSLAFAAIVAMLAGVAQSALADTVVDPQLFVCQSCTAPAGGDPNLITNTSGFNVGVAGNHTLQSPLLLIVGVYDGVGTPTITFAGGVSAPAIGLYGLTATSVPFTSSSSGSAFAQLGLNAGGSESFVNWSGADTGALGLPAPTSFTLYVFALNTTLMPGNSPVVVGESGAGAGSFIIAYGCQNTATPPLAACSGGDIGQSVFTNTGASTGVISTPEPASLNLIGAGLLALCGLARRRFLRN